MSYHNHYRWRFWHTGWGIAAAVVFGLVGAVVFAFLFGYIIMLLWNWIMPAIFSLGKIGFWQAFGIALLGRLIFGSFGHGYHGKRWHGYRHHRGPDWENDWDWGWDDDSRLRGGRRQWRYYKDFWREEGRAAFENYLERKIQSEKQQQSEPGK